MLTLSRQMRAGHGNDNDNDGNDEDVDGTEFITT